MQRVHRTCDVSIAVLMIGGDQTIKNRKTRDIIWYRQLATSNQEVGNSIYKRVHHHNPNNAIEEGDVLVLFINNAVPKFLEYY
jgi:hypothetical protein